MCVCVCVWTFSKLCWFSTRPGIGSTQHARCVWKSSGNGVTQFISIPKNKLRFLSLKVIHLESNALSHLSFPHFYALLVGFFWDATHLRCYGPLAGLYVFKIGFLDGPFEIKKNEKVTRSGEWSCYSSSATFLSVGNSRRLWALWTGSPLWWSSHNLFGHNSHLFLRCERNIHCRISLYTCKICLLGSLVKVI